MASRDILIGCKPAECSIALISSGFEDILQDVCADGG
jgi:hypothetical protein